MSLSKTLKSKSVIAIIIVVVVAGTLGLLFVEPIISTFPFIAPQDEFMIPFVEIEEDPLEPEPIQEEIGQPTEDIGIDPIEDAVIVCITTPCIDNEIIVCEEGSDCELLPPITSEDPPEKQIGDELDGLCTEDNIESCVPITIQVCPPFCGTDTIRLNSLIAKTDSQGTKTFVTESIQVQMLSFFVEDTTNIDFSDGFLEIRTKVFASDPTLRIVGSATFDIRVNNQTILPTGIEFTVNGIELPDGFGAVAVLDISCEDPITGVRNESCEFLSNPLGVGGVFISPTGIESNTFTFSFKDNLDKFPDGISTLEFVLIDSEFTLDSRSSFGATKLVLFTMTIASDPNLIIITDEMGELQRIYPKDDRIVYYNYGDKYVDGLNCRSYWARHAGTISLFDSEDNLLVSKAMPHSRCSTFTAFDLNIFRNQEYRLVHVSNGNDHPETHFDVKFTTPKSQKNISLACYWSNTVGVGCTYPNADVSEILRAPPL